MSISPLSCDDLPQGTLSVAQAQTAILSRIRPITNTELLPLTQLAGRVLAQDIDALHPVPPYRNASMDGYALNSATLTINELLLRQWRIVGQAFAGHPYTGVLQSGECIRIMTGAIVPDAADTVVMQENVQHQHNAIQLTSAPKLGENIRHIGDDLRQGETVLHTGKILNAADIGLIASLGIKNVAVRQRPRVAFCSTGDELQALGQPLSKGKIYDSNRYTLHTMLNRLGVELLDLGIIPDEPQAVEHTFRQARQQADVLITSGGVSVGDADYVTATLGKLGRINFWKIAMKPGKPLAFGQLGNCHFFGLPGNPVSVMATFLVFVRPALLALSGITPSSHPTFKAICTTPLKKAIGRQDFQRGIYQMNAQGQYEVSTTGLQDSHVLRSMSLANCFIVLPQEGGDVSVGSLVEIMPFGEWF